MVNMVEMLYMVWAPFGLREIQHVCLHICLYMLGMGLEGNIRKWLTAVTFRKGKWETGRKDGKEIYLSS